jgi:hypothetical protein
MAPNETPAANPNATYIALALEEYRALRAEIILCLERRITILSYGLTAIGVLVAAAINAFGPRQSMGTNPPSTSPIVLSLGEVILLIVLPTTAFYVLWIWFAETRRVRRASQYLYGLERDINTLVGKCILRWEHSLRPERWFNRHYWITFLFFG